MIHILKDVKKGILMVSVSTASTACITFLSLSAFLLMMFSPLNFYYISCFYLLSLNCFFVLSHLYKLPLLLHYPVNFAGLDLYKFL